MRLGEDVRGWERGCVILMSIYVTERMLFINQIFHCLFQIFLSIHEIARDGKCLTENNFLVSVQRMFGFKYFKTNSFMR